MLIEVVLKKVFVFTGCRWYGGNIVGISCPQEAFSKMDVIDYKHLLDVIFNGRRAHLVS